ncbi:hypothetical protein BBBOND_0402300 [Babesia bigemina]|uniref:Uncharacterized protein n=1 Tax=Babesia bigemina TaxID=5866 RepID=A0A061DAM8_BABBI|nr:hypothetical protein BBBOND_0402300 [Babesia bigemina]CDR97741.1 hypothetical protein BBBOND_0402300 [Babesia bigemina]|eukprot:XP_012769927.1 hypothetical protein BBBOND_0402300 [Babesia bigemina]
MVYKSLTDIPRNVKEGIDWLIALRGTDAETNFNAMGVALHKLLADKPVGTMKVPALENVKQISKQFMEQTQLSSYGFVREMISRYNKRMSKRKPCFLYKSFIRGDQDECHYMNVVKAHNVTAELMSAQMTGITSSCERFLGHIRNPGKYKSAYSPEATWQASCAQDPEGCAVIFVGIAPMLYAGIICLWLASAPPLLRWSETTDNTHLRIVMKELGYVVPECLDGLTRLHVREALRDMHHRLLDVVYDMAGFWAFY